MDLKSTSPLDDDCTIFMSFIGAEYQPIDPLATLGADYVTDIENNQEFFLSEGFESREFEVAKIVDDFDPPEGNESFGLIFDIVFQECPADVAVDLTRDLLDVKILDNETNSTYNLIDDSSVILTPTIVETNFTVKSEKYTITTIEIFDSQGRIIYIFNDLNRFNTSINIGDVNAKGILYIHILTNKGSVVKKILKI